MQSSIMAMERMTPASLLLPAWQLFQTSSRAFHPAHGSRLQKAVMELEMLSWVIIGSWIAPLIGTPKDAHWVDNWEEI